LIFLSVTQSITNNYVYTYVFSKETVKYNNVNGQKIKYMVSDIKTEFWNSFTGKYLEHAVNFMSAYVMHELLPVLW
jgi:hypothetical protein